MAVSDNNMAATITSASPESRRRDPTATSTHQVTNIAAGDRRYSRAAVVAAVARTRDVTRLESLVCFFFFMTIFTTLMMI
jgi:hypothetical protein